MIRTVLVSLASIAVCVACDECFELGVACCPACRSKEYLPLASLLERQTFDIAAVN